MQTRSARWALLVAAAGTTFALGIAPAAANTAPQLTCGSSQPGPCSQTAHFTQQQGLQTPIGRPTRPSNCPSWVLRDFVLLNFTGNGVEHVTVNGAQDFWFTATFAGFGRVKFYPRASLSHLVFDDEGNIVSFRIVGPADKVAHGRLTDWFGGSGNNHNAVFSGTVNFGGTDSAGHPFTLHAVQHTSWTGQQNPMSDPPHLNIASVTC